MPAKTATTFATVDQLLSKPQRIKTLPVTVTDADGTETEVTVKVAAIGAKAYDDLLAAHPPTQKQKKDDSSASYNYDSFPPALIAACAVEPALDNDQAVELWNSEHWSRGELQSVFMGCVEVNASGLDVPFNELASGTTRRSR